MLAIVSILSSIDRGIVTKCVGSCNYGEVGKSYELEKRKEKVNQWEFTEF